MPKEQKLWLKLDNAAKIYPAAMRKKWMAMFRFSFSLTENVDLEVLSAALRRVNPRFPSFFVRLKRGLFWFYLDYTNESPGIQSDVANPCARMDLRRNKFLFRLRCFENRIALEVFHVLSDGTGSLCFFKTLVAEYLRLKYGAVIPRDESILSIDEPPKAAELEDSFLKHAGRVARNHRDANAYFVRGAPVPLDTIHITTGLMPLEAVSARAREKKVSITEYLTSVMIMSLDAIQRRSGRPERRLKPVKVAVPVNLRAFFPSETLRNFSYFINVGIDSHYGEYTLDEIISDVHHFIRLEATKQKLRARIAWNVNTEKNPVLRLVPLFVKNFLMRIVYSRVGDRKTTTTITNMGAVKLPEEMSRYITRTDVILGPLLRNRVVAAVISYKDTLEMTFTRTITDSRVEREFFRNLVKLGIPVKLESNNLAQENALNI
jgi:NRPS condensation-like uncharacterized protein